MTHLFPNKTKETENIFRQGNSDQVIDTTWNEIEITSDLFNISTFPFDVYDASQKKIMADPNVTFNQYYLISLQFTIVNILLCTGIQFKLEIIGDQQRAPITVLLEENDIGSFSSKPLKFSDGFFMGEQWRDNGARAYMRTDAGTIRIEKTTLKIIRP